MQRTLAIASAGLPASAAILAYNRDAVSCLGYVSQVVHLPQLLMKKQHAIVAKIFKIPYYGMGCDAPFRFMSDIRTHAPTCLDALNKATLARASHRTLSWRPLVNVLRDNYDEFASLWQLATGSFSPIHWESEAIAITLQKAHTFLTPKLMQQCCLGQLAK